MYFTTVELFNKRHDSNLIEILRNTEDVQFYYNTTMIHTEPHNSDILGYLKLIGLLKKIPSAKFSPTKFFDKLCKVTGNISKSEAIKLVIIATEINYCIEKILCKFYVANSITEIISVTNFAINYDYVFVEALNKNTNNRAIFEHIVSNNYVNSNSFDYSKVPKKCISYDFLDVLLTHGFDIANYPIDSSMVYEILTYISPSNIKYFSNIKIELSAYIKIIRKLPYDKIKEFERYYNTDNIIIGSEKSETNAEQSHRAQILINSGINLEPILNSIICDDYELLEYI